MTTESDAAATRAPRQFAVAGAAALAAAIACRTPPPKIASRVVNQFHSNRVWTLAPLQCRNSAARRACKPTAAKGSRNVA